MGPSELSAAIIAKAGTPGVNGHVYAANTMAGTKGFPLVGALNVIAGNAKTAYRDLEGVLNQLAGTKNWGENAAASRWAGLI
jgi:hypothetical protein